ncbi:MAG: hypothetical protein V3V67_06750 [Myxococcota bacterium]
MSTVLEALRKLQREREAQRSPWQLGASVTDLIVLGPPRRRRWGRWLGAAAGLGLVAGALGVFLLVGSLSPAEGLPALASATELQTPEVSSAPIRGSSELETEAADARRAPLGMGGFAPEPAPGEPVGVLEPQPDVARRAPLSRASATPVRSEPSAPTGSEPEAGAGLERDVFPDVRMDRIRWHPDPARRIAYLRVSGRPELAAYEGDIVAGLLVHRIDPDGVELGVGSARRLLQLGR